MIAEDTLTLAVDGRPVRVRITGPESGTPVLLIHGITRSLEDWVPAQDLLAAAGHRVIAADLPGFGLTRKGVERPGLPGFARALAKLLDAADVTAPVHLMGNSLGGGVAMTLAADRPERVASLTLVNSIGFGVEAHVSALPLAYGVLGALPGVGKSFKKRSREAGIQGIRDIFFDPELATADQLRLAGMLSRQPDFRATFLGTAAWLGGLVPGSRPALGQKAGWRRELLAKLTARGIPTLVVWGDTDRVIPTHHFDAARAALPDAESHLFAETGHMPQFERPADFVAVAGDFIAKVDANAG